jgi:hypothetical protein
MNSSLLSFNLPKITILLIKRLIGIVKAITEGKEYKKINILKKIILSFTISSTNSKNFSNKNIKVNKLKHKKNTNGY